MTGGEKRLRLDLSLNLLVVSLPLCSLFKIEHLDCIFITCNIETSPMSLFLQKGLHEKISLLQKSEQPQEPMEEL